MDNVAAALGGLIVGGILGWLVGAGFMYTQAIRSCQSILADVLEKYPGLVCWRCREIAASDKALEELLCGPKDL